MLFKREWILALGILAMGSSLTMAGEPRFKLFRSTKPQATQGRSSQDVANDIGKALSKAKLQGKDVEIEYINGVATISGKVTDPRQKAMAEHVAMMVPEVKSVQNKLVLQGAAPKAAPSPAAFADFQQAFQKPAAPIQQVSATSTAAAREANTAKAQQIATALQQSGISGYDMEISYEDGVVGLNGIVGSPEQRFIAEQVVRQTGATKVQNRLQVAQAAPNPMMQAMQAPPMSGPPIHNASFQPPMAPAPGPMAAPGPVNKVYNQPYMPSHSWPTYAAYPNYSQVSYPKQYSASAWPYIGPFYPYPQVPLGWRKSSLEWDDGQWQLKFDSKTDRWWWFLNPGNWD